ncbi:hypothetical protein HA402_015169 [Bradysia odoriphaga]|nr:hypothetical protein HA402_015169 [Bradysia odoriphaga]
MSIVEDLSKNCRLCMKAGKNVHSIFSENPRKLTVPDVSKLIYECLNIEVTVNDSTTGLCLLCYKQIKSIGSFRERCARANELFQERCKQSAKTDTIPERTEVNVQIECGSIPFVDLGAEHPVTRSNSLWTKDENNFGEISDFEMPSPDPCKADEQISSPTSEGIHDKESVPMENEINEQENESGKTLHKPRCKMKQKSTKQTQKCSSGWPKLKKRDLIETKAYRGLCHLCGKEYQHLWVHLQSHSDAPTETCDICGKGFRSKANLSLHILLHKEADMPCEVCGKKYRTKMRLKRHMRVHTNHRPFFCSVCQKRFYTKYNLEVHGRIHSGERPFLCSAKMCNERFAHSYALKHHVDKVHGESCN